MRGLLKNDQNATKLRLHKETLTLLEDNQLRPVVGAESNSICPGTGRWCCQVN